MVALTKRGLEECLPRRGSSSFLGGRISETFAFIFLLECFSLFRLLQTEKINKELNEGLT